MVEINPLLPESLSFFTPLSLNSISLYYSISTVYATSFNNSLRLFIELPLKGVDRQFTLYKALELPTRIGVSSYFMFIRPEHQYLAVSRDLSKFITMEQEDLSHCRGEEVRICNPRRPIQESPEQDCLYALFRGIDERAEALCTKFVIQNPKSVFYASRDTTQWVYSLAKPTKILVKCLTAVSRPVRMFHKIINETGIIHLDYQCMAMVDGNNLLPHFNAMSKISRSGEKFIIPAIYPILAPEFSTALNLSVANSEKTFKEITGLLNQTFNLNPRKEGVKMQHIYGLIKDLDERHSVEASYKFQFYTNYIMYAVVILAAVIIVIYKGHRLIKGWRIRVQGVVPEGGQQDGSEPLGHNVTTGGVGLVRQVQSV
jgi:hypothetical protein